MEILWIDWPDSYSNLQHHAIDTEHVDHWFYKARAADVLVLDDLGAEAISKRSDDVSTNFAHGVLANVIRARNADKSLILWTSNVGQKLKDLYAPAMLSRLLASAPLIIIPNTVRNYRLPPV